MKLGILGCGYTGQRLAMNAMAHGHQVVGSTRSEARRAELEALGITARTLSLDDGGALRSFFEGLDAIVHLAPPPADAHIEEEVARIARTAPSSLSSFVYGSTTGVFGQVEGWIDEATEPGPQAPRGRARARYEAALRAAGLPLRVARIAGIYGPGRTIKQALDRGLVLFEGGPPTSRVHVEDLARLLEAMTEADAPSLVIACDDEPAPTLEVAGYVADLLGEELPPVLSIDEARAQMSPAAIEMRLGGRRCRSVERPRLIGELRYPTYREGMRAALVEDGLLSPQHVTSPN